MSMRDDLTARTFEEMSADGIVLGYMADDPRMTPAERAVLRRASERTHWLAGRADRLDGLRQPVPHWRPRPRASRAADFDFDAFDELEAAE